MKVYTYIILCALGITAICSCGKKQEAEVKKDFTETVSAQDTTAVMNMTGNCMELFKSGKFDDALNMIYTINDDNILVSLPDSLRRRMKQRLTLFPVVDYSLESFYFAKSDSNEVKYSFRFVPDNPDMTMKMVYNPVKLGDEWYIVMKGLM